MRVPPSLVLGEEHGVGHLSYVMIECSRAHEKAVGAYLAGYFGSQIAHGYGVLEGAGHGFGHAAQQRIVDVGQFDQRHVRGKAECFFQYE